MKTSRFTDPNYRMLAFDDVDFKYLENVKRMKKRSNGCTCVLISAKEMQDVVVKHFGIEVTMGFLIVHMVWGTDGDAVRAAEIKAATVREADEDPNDVGVQFVQDLHEFIDMNQELSLEELLTENFIEL